MNSMLSCTFDAYKFGASIPLDAHQLSKLVESFSERDQAVEFPLGGRRAISATRLEGIGPVVVKHYRRGGWLSHLVKKTYLKLGKPRCRLEFEQMQGAIRAGVRVPEPIAYAYRGLVFYNAWLVTRKISNQQSLAQLSLDAPDRAEAATHALVDQVAKLIDHRIFHADFHPGNILVDNKDDIYIIDFDKAGPFQGSTELLKHRYLKRWHRAVIKHGLPDNLYDVLRENL